MSRLAHEMRFPLMPWQGYIHDVANEVDPVTGWWSYDEVVIVVPRQAGKTTLKFPLYAHRFKLLKRGEFWMTAQSGKKAVKRWSVAAQAMLDIPELNPSLKQWVSNSHEKLLWKPTGTSLVPFAPDDENMHGESPDLVDIDEWWAFDALEAEGLAASYEPGFLTRNSQAWKTSTMGTPASAGLNADVKKGRASVEMDRRSGVAYFEWSIEDEPFGIPIEELTDLQLAEACVAIHPAVGFHPYAPAEKMRHKIITDLTEHKISRSEYIRAYGNRVQTLTGGWAVILQPQWVAAMAARAIPHGVPVGLGFEVDPDGRDASIAVVWRGPDGHATGELIKLADGAGWLPAMVVALTNRWDVVQIAVQNSGPARQAADTVQRLLKAQADLEGEDPWELLRMSQVDFSAACARLHTEVTAPRPTFHHIGQAPVNTAVEHATKRRTGPLGAWAWKIDETVSITPLVAMTAALWAVDHPRDVVRLGRFKIR